MDDRLFGKRFELGGGVELPYLDASALRDEAIDKVICVRSEIKHHAGSAPHVRSAKRIFSGGQIVGRRSGVFDPPLKTPQLQNLFLFATLSKFIERNVGYSIAVKPVDGC